MFSICKMWNSDYHLFRVFYLLYNYNMTSPETANNPEAREWQSQSQEIADLKKQLEETKKQLENTKKQLDDLKKTQTTTPENPASDRRVTVQSFGWENDIDTELYGWNKGEKITKKEVLDVVNALKEPFNTEITDFIKSNNIDGLQKYLNQKIKDWKIDVSGLEAALKAKNIRFDGSILEDWKFGPQTLETIKFILQQQEEKPEEKEKEKKAPDLGWIPQEMSAVMKDIKDTDILKNWSPERNIGEDNFNVDVDKHIISITTWWTSLNSLERAHVPGNRCEINWDTGAITVVCNNRKYEMPIHVEGFKLKDWVPDGNDIKNRERVRAFATIGNLMNQLKAHSVYNGSGAIEEASWTLEMNDGTLWLKDTDLVSSDAFDKINIKYSHLWVKFDRETKVQTASLLTAMKLDLWKIKWDPDIESSSWYRKDPLDDEHKKWVKHYSQTYGRGS